MDSVSIVRAKNSKTCGHVVVFPHRVTSNTASKMASYTRYASGKFAKSKRGRRKEKKSRIVIEHNYMTDLCKNEDDALGINTPVDLDLPKYELHENIPLDVFIQYRPRSACASAQTDQIMLSKRAKQKAS